MFRVSLLLTLLGAILILVSVAISVVFPFIFESIINEKLIIRPNSDTFKRFQETTTPINFQIWLFNLTNSQKVYGGAKPVFQQLGPYTYKQKNTRVGIRWNHELGSVTFRAKKFYHFDAEKSNGSEDDLVTTINPVFLTLAARLGGSEIIPAAKGFAYLWFLRFNLQPFMTRSVGELLFQGYDEPLLAELYQLTNDPKYASGKFGFLQDKNGTEGLETEIYTGERGMEKFRNIVRWNNSEKLEHWPEDRCNAFNGTDGSQFPRPLQRNQPISFFIPDLCRSTYAVYEKDVQFGPLTLYRFVLPPELLSVEKDKCFCTSNFTCRNSMIDVSPCRKAPVVISKPHFYHGDEKDINEMVGLHPVKEEHETYMDIEPYVGVVLRAAKRMQLNMALRKFVNFPSFKNIPEIIFPVFWINETAATSSETAEKLYAALHTPLLVVYYGSWALLTIGCLLIFSAAVLFYKTYKKDAELAKRRQELSDITVDGKSKKLMLK